jgi:peptide-methionine (S)-S-oxide reductase
VVNVTVGYAGGSQTWPTYRNIKDHTEAVRVVYNAGVISYEEILDHFIREIGLPTSPSYLRQYRPAILVHNEEQYHVALEKIGEWTDKCQRKVYIDIETATDFYRAEEYHQKYLQKNR